VSPSGGVVDFQSPPANHNCKASIEPPDTVPDGRVRRFKDVIVFLMLVGFVLLIT
jgi:hypothetical protein